MPFNHNPLLGNTILPVDIVLLPEWWNKNEKITSIKTFFYHPLKRVEVEQQKKRYFTNAGDVTD